MTILEQLWNALRNRLRNALGPFFYPANKPITFDASSLSDSTPAQPPQPIPIMEPTSAPSVVPEPSLLTTPTVVSAPSLLTTSSVVPELSMTPVSLGEEAIAKALGYVDLQSTNDAAPWLDDLMREGGNPAHWSPGEPYCISAAAACWGLVLKAHGIPWPFQAVPGTQQFYDHANAAEFLTLSPKPGDIVIYKDGETAHGHAGIVIAIDTANLHTVEFNTSPTDGGNQRAGNGCFRKVRSRAAFHGPRTSGMWIRGYVGMTKVGPLK